MVFNNCFFHKLILFLFILLLQSCADEGYSGEVQQNKKMAVSAIIKGDTSLYYSSSNRFLASSNPGSFIFFANAMALQHNNSSAYYDVYFINSNLRIGIEEDKESPFYYFLLYNLAKSYELGYDLTEEYLMGDTFTTGNIRSSKYYFKKAFHDMNKK